MLGNERKGAGNVKEHRGTKGQVGSMETAVDFPSQRMNITHLAMQGCPYFKKEKGSCGVLKRRYFLCYTQRNWGVATSTVFVLTNATYQVMLWYPPTTGALPGACAGFWEELPG